MKRSLILLALPLLALSCAHLEPAVGTRPERPATGEAAKFQEQEAQALLNHATELYGQKKYNEAKYQADDLLVKFPSSALVPDAKYLLAKMLFDQKLTDQAIAAASEVADTYPNATAATRTRKLLGDCFLAKADYLKAGQQYIEALKTVASDDERDEIRQPLSVIVAERLGKEELRILYRKYPQNELAPAMGLKLAGIEIAAKNNDEAKKLLNEIIKGYPQAPEAERATEMLAQFKQGKEVAAASDDTRRIGVIVPLSGKYGEYGIAAKQGVELAFDEYNATAVNKYKLAVRDSKGDPIDAIRCVYALADSVKALGVIGEVLSGPTVAAAGAANALELPLVSPTASEERIATIGPNVFQLTQSISWQGAAVAAYAVSKFNFKTLAVLYPKEAAWENVANAFIQEAAKQDAPVPAAQIISYDPGTTDFKDIIEKLKQAKIQALFIPAPPGDIVMIAPQLVYNLLKVQLLGTDSWGDPKILAQGDVYVEGAVFAVAAPTTGQAQAAKAFEDKFTKKFGKTPSKLAAQAYDGAKIMLQALAKGPATREELRAALQTVEITAPGVSGPIAMGKTNARPKAMFKTIKNKTVVDME